MDKVQLRLGREQMDDVYDGLLELQRRSPDSPHYPRWDKLRVWLKWRREKAFGDR